MSSFCSTGWSDTRRGFVKRFALFSATAALPGAPWRARVLADVQPPPTDAGVLKLRLADFPTLQKDFGSVRIGTSAVGTDHRPKGLFYPVLINRGPGGKWYALDSACSHEGCTVPTFNASSRVMECPCHGSQYLLDGTVQRGPANFPLRQFPIQFDGENLAISVPDVSFSLEATQVQAGPGRLRLDFIAFEQIQYELRYRPDAAGAWTGPVPFALRPDGPADQTTLTGQANIAEVYLDQTNRSGLYAVAMRVKQV
jgi:Rieske Fe-S protein